MIKFILSLARHFDVEALPVTLTAYPCVAATPAFSLSELYFQVYMHLLHKTLFIPHVYWKLCKHS